MSIYEYVRNRYEKDKDETATHCIRSSILALEFAKSLGFTEAELDRLEQGAILHDIGKYEIPEEVLYKEGRLTEAEFETVKGHVLKAKDLLEFEILDNDIADIIIQHHERPDGKGYPYGLKGEEINKLSKLFSLVDVYDALINVRVYKKAKSVEEALSIIQEGLGNQFDNDLGISFITFINNKMNNRSVVGL